MSVENAGDTSSVESGPLAGLRVVEIDRGLAQYCGKLLADMGAEVIKIEPPEGAPARRVLPFVGDVADPDRSLFFWHYNMNKRSVVLDLASEPARDAVRKLARSADVILEDLGPQAMADLGLGYAELRSLNERLVYAQVTPVRPRWPLVAVRIL